MKLKTNLYAPLVAFGFLGAASQSFGLSLDCTGGCIDQSFAGAIFTTAEISPAGTGVFDTFVQIQRNESEQGYNTTVNNVFDNGSSDVHNHELSLSSVPLKLIGGLLYREFALDTNESTNTSEISLDGLQLYLSTTPNQSTTTVSSLGNLVYDLSSGAANSVLLDSEFIGSGSGDSDLFVYIPETLFAAALVSLGSADPYVYLWSHFGLTDNFNSDAGFEEWGVQAANAVPEPASAALMLLGLGALAKRRKRA